MRAKKTFTELLTITKNKIVNWAEVHAQNIYKNHLRSLQFYQMPKDSLSNTLKTSTEAYKLFTDNEEPLNTKRTFSLTTKFKWRCLTKRTLKIFSQGTGYTNKEPGKCLHYTKGSCEPKSRKWPNRINNFIWGRKNIIKNLLNVDYIII
jgi:hypothetical protein